MILSDVCLTSVSVCLSRTSGLTREQRPKKTKIIVVTNVFYVFYFHIKNMFFMFFFNFVYVFFSKKHYKL